MSARPSYLAGKRVAVSGAGIGGTAFALALEQACKARNVSPMPTIKIYERDASPTARENLGYSFSIREGLPVLYKLQRGIMEELKHLREPSNAAHFCYKTFQPLIKLSPSSDSHAKFEILRVMRTRMRQTLLSKVPPDWMQYGKVCCAATPARGIDQHVQIKFEDGTEEECDILVVADGANSKLRSALLPGEVKRYAGVCMLFGRTRPLRQVPSELLRGINLVLGSGGTSLFMGTVDKNTVTWSLTSKGPSSRDAELNDLFKDPVKAQRLIPSTVLMRLAVFLNALRTFEREIWHPILFAQDQHYLQAFKEHEIPKLAAEFSEPFFQMVRETDVSSLIAYPATDKLPHAVQDTGIVYIGDAWHPMSPFAGAGADNALQDAWELAQHLTGASHKSAQAAISEFASRAASRSADAINASRRNIAFAHSEGWRKQLFIGILWTLGRILLQFETLSNSLKSLSGTLKHPSSKAHM